MKIEKAWKGLEFSLVKDQLSALSIMLLVIGWSMLMDL